MTDSATLERLAANSEALLGEVRNRSKLDFHEQRMVDMEAEFQTMLTGVKSHFPVTPNLLADTRQFRAFCQGEVNTPMDIVEASAGSMYGATFYNGTLGSGTMSIISLPELVNNGCEYGEDLAKATNPSWYGSNFRVMVVDITIASGLGGDVNGTDGFFFMRSPIMPTQSGWNKGETKNQSTSFVNVISHQGDITLSRVANNSKIFDGSDADKGWQFNHAARTAFGGMFHLFDFRNSGHMKVAIALPYLGTGDHGGAFFNADAIQPPEMATVSPNNHIYTHTMG